METIQSTSDEARDLRCRLEAAATEYAETLDATPTTVYEVWLRVPGMKSERHTLHGAARLRAALAVWQAVPDATVDVYEQVTVETLRCEEQPIADVLEGLA